MKFHNITKLNVKVGDKVQYIIINSFYNFTTIETVYSVDKGLITTISKDYDQFVYYSNGIPQQPFSGLLHTLIISSGRIHEIP